MGLVRMDIQTLAVGAGPVPSLIVLRNRPAEGKAAVQLPIRIGPVEAAAISVGLDDTPRARPLTHDLLQNTITSLGAVLEGVAIVDVQGTTFFAQLFLLDELGRRLNVDCRPSDGIALAVRMDAPIYADDHVIEAASVPNFQGVERDEKDRELERFHDFVESLSPEDFA